MVKQSRLQVTKENKNKANDNFVLGVDIQFVLRIYVRTTLGIYKLNFQECV